MSRRQELLEFVETGRLRDVANDAGLSSEAQDLLVDVVRRYCEPPRRKPPSEGNGQGIHDRCPQCGLYKYRMATAEEICEGHHQGKSDA